MRLFVPVGFFLPFAALACLPTCAQAQAPADSATFLLHKFAQRIGKETYRLTRTAQAHTSRFSSLNDTVRVAADYQH